MTDIKGNKVLLIAVIIAVAASAVWTANYKLHFNGFFLNDAHDFGQMARNIYEGRGFKTSVLRPINIIHFKQIPYPEVTRPPLFPLILAGLFSVFGVNDFAIVLSGAIAYVALAVLTFLVAMKLTESYLIALFGSVLASFHLYFLPQGILGTSDLVYAACFMGFIYFYLRKQELIFWHGVIIGLLYLLRTNTLFVAIPLLLMELRRRDATARWNSFLLFSVGALIPIFPYLVRNYIDTGSPLFSLHKYTLALETRTYPGFTLWTQINDVSAGRFFLDHPGEVFRKFSNSMISLKREFFASFQFPGVVMLLAGLTLPLKGTDLQKIRRLVLWIILLQLVLISPMGSGGLRFYMFLIPLAVISFGAVISRFSETAASSREVLAAVLAIVAVVMLYPSLEYWKDRSAVSQPNLSVEFGKTLKAMTGKEDVIASDIAWEISWYADRKTVWLPYDPDTLRKISASVPVKYVFLSVLITRPFAAYKDDTWQRMFLKPDSIKVEGLEFVQQFYLNNYPVGILYKVAQIN
ncbi:MAG: hypothetical protein EPN25_04770 [Nitrospirae bacterium]|nr:MAG: hypothetical protein EPN25_04770 [Nitrospirota bacterium]